MPLRWAPGRGRSGGSSALAARLRKAGGGSAVPGLVVNRVAPGFLGDVLSSFPEGLVVVSGSSGKSTTTKMLVAVLTAHGKRVFTNPSTANISQGLTSALLERASLTGRIDADLAVLEMDEGHGALLSDRFRARLVLLTNVMTDQIDRFHDAEKVQAMLGRIAATAGDAVVLNGDDALLDRAPPRRRGASASASPPRCSPRPRAGSGYAATSPTRVEDGVLVDVRRRPRRRRAGPRRAALPIRLPARGVHYAVDAAGALAAAEQLLGDAFDPAPRRGDARARCRRCSVAARC